MKADLLRCSDSALSATLLTFRVTSDQYRPKGKEEHSLGEHMIYNPTAGLTCMAGSETHKTVWRTWRDSRGRKNRRQKSWKLGTLKNEYKELERQQESENFRRKNPCSLPSPPQKHARLFFSQGINYFFSVEFRKCISSLCKKNRCSLTT